MNTDLVRWLDKDADYLRAAEYWRAYGIELSQHTWEMAHYYGYQYAAILVDEKIISVAAAWKFSEECWEVAAVSTLESHQRKGYARSVVSFITAYIHQNGRLATCSTRDDNLAMIATAISVGFHIVPAEEVWWKFPELPDF